MYPGPLLHSLVHIREIRRSTITTPTPTPAASTIKVGLIRSSKKILKMYPASYKFPQFYGWLYWITSYVLYVNCMYDLILIRFWLSAPLIEEILRRTYIFWISNMYSDKLSFSYLKVNSKSKSIFSWQLPDESLKRTCHFQNLVCLFFKLKELSVELSRKIAY